MSESTVTAALNRTREVRAATASGYRVLFGWLVLLALALWAGIGNGTAEVQVAWKWVLVVVAATLGTLILLSILGGVSRLQFDCAFIGGFPDMYIVGFNGPPRSGKDTLAENIGRASCRERVCQYV